MAGDSEASALMEIVIAQLYRLSREDFGLVLKTYDKLSEDEVGSLMSERNWEAAQQYTSDDARLLETPQKIPNHYSWRGWSE